MSGCRKVYEFKVIMEGNLKNHIDLIDTYTKNHYEVIERVFEVDNYGCPTKIELEFYRIFPSIEPSRR